MTVCLNEGGIEEWELKQLLSENGSTADASRSNRRQLLLNS